MKTLAIAAAIATAIAAPAFAQSSPLAIAVDQFNASVDSYGDRIALPSHDRQVIASAGSTAAALDVFNGSEDRVSDRRGLERVTVVSGTPAYGADVFEALRAADDTN